ncbi:isoprenylcysteine carboxyl methyltransferase family protein [Kroppenstedtia guangzhouensis]|uniref:isoprenylcysteine carboxyl methyltransferase family protein n=1 Tax=Kroppenstedtia guangzhouensis TaxID=1274356 RepID=UPI00166BCF32|nr:isoprenylcysteine carboxylmethyltransferase family protein [Kroppenstedtia guangzhouensis]
MSFWFPMVMTGLLLQRGAELLLARKHTRWIRSQGGVEVGRGHYPLLVGIHLLFFISLAWEVIGIGTEPPAWWPIPFFLFLAAQGLRIWSIHSLGPYWNTRIWVVPGHPRVVRGPYKYLSHPNYVVVVTELLVLPLLFGAYVTAITLSVLNLLVLLKIRIPLEEKALTEAAAEGNGSGTDRDFGGD